MSDEAHVLIGRISAVIEMNSMAVMTDEQALERIRELYRAYNAQREEFLKA